MAQESKGVTGWASIGDVIETEMEFPYPRKHRELLTTPEAVAMGNELIASGRWWKADANPDERKVSHEPR